MLKEYYIVNKNTIDGVLEYLEKHDVKWLAGDKPTQWNPYRHALIGRIAENDIIALRVLDSKWLRYICKNDINKHVEVRLY